MKKNIYILSFVILILLLWPFRSLKNSKFPISSASSDEHPLVIDMEQQAINAISKFDRDTLVKVAKNWKNNKPEDVIPLFLLAATQGEENIFIYYKKYEEIIGWLEKLVKDFPNNCYAHFLLGLAYYDIYLYKEKMVPEFNKATNICPNFTEAIYHLGNAYYKLRKISLAMKEYENAIEIDPNYKDAHYNLGIVYISKGNYDMAIKQFKEVIRIKKDDAGAYLALAYVHGKLGDNKMELEALKKAIENDEKFSEAHHNLGLIYFKQEKDDLAIANYKKVTKEKARYEDAHYNLGFIYYDQGKYDMAITELENAKVPIGVDDPGIHYLLGIIYAKKGKIELSRRGFKEAIMQRPDITDIDVYDTPEPTSYMLKEWDKAFRRLFLPKLRNRKSIPPALREFHASYAHSC